MDIFETIYQRRSIRKYQDRVIPNSDLEKILDAARWAPNGGNQNMWRFIVVQSKAERELLVNYCPGIFSLPAAIIAVCIKYANKKSQAANRRVHIADAAIATENIALASHALGIGSCMVASFADLAVRELLEIPELVTPLLLITLGYPDESPEPPPRLPIDEIAFLDEYGKAWKNE
jgi:nitroreductase